MQKQCEAKNCQTIFEVNETHGSHKTKRYCSRKCKQSSSKRPTVADNKALIADYQKIVARMRELKKDVEDLRLCQKYSPNEQDARKIIELQARIVELEGQIAQGPGSRKSEEGAPLPRASVSDY